MSPAPRRPVFDDPDAKAPRQRGRGTNFSIHLHEPTEWQASIEASPAKMKIIKAGRRVGKTTFVADYSIRRALNGAQVLEAAPVTRQTDAYWRMVKNALGEGIALGKIHKTENPRHIEFMKAMGGGTITCKTAWDANTLRGEGADLLIFDEYSLMDPSVWDEVGMPMLLDNDGDAIFIFTPKRRNHAFILHNKAVADTSGDWAVWSATSHDNPYLSEKAFQRLVRNMSENAYKQEIMAEFLDTEGAVFRNVPECSNAPRNTTPEMHREHKIVTGVDWGKVNDFTVISNFCVTCKCEVDFDRFNRIDYSFQRERLKVSYEKWNPIRILAEANSMGEPIIEQLLADGLPVEGYYMTHTTKVDLINRLSLAFERISGQWLDVPIGKTELLAYEVRLTKGGNATYGAPKGMNDDTVISRGLAWWAAAFMAVPIVQYDYDDVPDPSRRRGERVSIFGPRRNPERWTGNG